jgi:hypothetical protein
MPKSGAEYAQELAGWGFNIVPAPLREKLPAMKWKRYQLERTDAKLGVWFSGRRQNYFIVTGRISGCIVLDVDSDAAEQWWRERIGEAMDQTTRVRTSSGWHYYFRLPDGVDVRNHSHHDAQTDIKWDIRGTGGGVIAPPSVHESGAVYEWDRGPEHMVLAPTAVISTWCWRRPPSSTPKRRRMSLVGAQPAASWQSSFRPLRRAKEGVTTG